MVHGPGLFGSWATEWSFMTSTVHERSRVAHAMFTIQMENTVME